nr:hypothetical chloroplast RF15 [Ranunculus cassubicifolius]YP_010828425.1 hypothetical chloroplast RF15 [Ranunculus cassubicifolius]WFF45900.1 hypothetical chloroplast RF15 [Ranunculus cassubicifolius]WFF45912.1 hypothetical chloroplast RF15 [Ranunculus cassubicifolius]
MRVQLHCIALPESMLYI